VKEILRGNKVFVKETVQYLQKKNMKIAGREGSGVCQVVFDIWRGFV